MPATFFIGDPHFGHKLVAGIRGFSNTDDHDNTIIRKWRKQVKPDDTVHVMGDISGGGREAEIRALRIIYDLPGRKQWKLGNHDGASGIHKQVLSVEHRMLIAETFEKVNDFGHFSFEGRQVLLSHFPYAESEDGPGRGHGRYRQWRLPDLGNVLVHAHTHHNHPTNGSATGREICVSWDAWNRMVDMGDIHRLIKEMNLPAPVKVPYRSKGMPVPSWVDLVEKHKDI